MDIVIISHGLGNQMSQYAFFLKKREISKSTYYLSFCTHHNGLELDKIFEIPWKEHPWRQTFFILFRILHMKKMKWVSKPLQWIFNLLNINIIDENLNYNFNDTMLRQTHDFGITFFFGGWHSEKYFLSIQEKIAATYQFSKPTDTANINFAKKISECNSVSIHVRRGDYLSPKNLAIFGEVCNKTYFEHAVRIIEARVENPSFFVFSNDINWVRDNLSIKNMTIVACNTSQGSWKDMYLMSLCKHNIVANSTFSWWGAWLNKNPNKIVISPRRFMNHDTSTEFYPDSWIKVDEH